MGMFILGMFIGAMAMAFVVSVGNNNKEHEAWVAGYYDGFEDGKATVEKE